MRTRSAAAAPAAGRQAGPSPCSTSAMPNSLVRKASKRQRPGIDRAGFGEVATARRRHRRIEPAAADLARQARAGRGAHLRDRSAAADRRSTTSFRPGTPVWWRLRRHKRRTERRDDQAVARQDGVHETCARSTSPAEDETAWSTFGRDGTQAIAVGARRSAGRPPSGASRRRCRSRCRSRRRRSQSPLPLGNRNAITAAAARRPKAARRALRPPCRFAAGSGAGDRGSQAGSALAAAGTARSWSARSPAAPAHSLAPSRRRSARQARAASPPRCLRRRSGCPARRRSVTMACSSAKPGPDSISRVIHCASNLTMSGFSARTRSMSESCAP